MRRIALTAWLGVLAALAPAFGQSPASLGKPVPAAQVARTIAPSPRVRAQADDTPTLGVPEPYPAGYQPAHYYYPSPSGYGAPAHFSPQAANPSSFYPTSYQPNIGSGSFTTQSWPYPGSPDGAGYQSPRGEAVRRTSFSSRSARSESRFTDSINDCASDCCNWMKGCFNGDKVCRFQSDHSMDSFISPVTNPFLFEDPRSLTEIRPIFIYQQIPSNNPVFNGGNAYFYGVQARLALTESWSITMNKLGGVTIDSDNPTIGDASGIAEFDIGPKYTFLRKCDTGTFAAAGAIFQIPIGPSKVYQDTGNLSLVPYVSLAQSFGRSSYGTFNFMDTLGYAFGFDGRSDYLYNSAHLDYDIANLHKFYALLELNWFYYSTSGEARAINQEGRDYANMGGTGVSGNNYLTIAPGFRYKFSEQVQFGLATEFALTNPRDLQDFRLLVDMIFRY